MKNTPQTQLVRQALERLGHATNQELLAAVSGQLPGITATTVHRITTRLVEAGEISLAPVREGVAVLDTRSPQHDHFVCRDCHKIKDITLTASTIADIQSQLPREIISGGLVIYGSCRNCPAQPNT